MATINKTMKTMSVPSGSDTVKYTITDEQARQDLLGKASKVTGGTTGNFVSLDANGDLQDSGHKDSDYLKEHQDISGKADKVVNGTENNFAALDANGNLKDSGHKHSDYITEHQDISGKADKDTDAVEGNFAAFDGNGNPVDSGKKASDFVASSAFYATEMPVSELDSTKVATALSDVKSQIQQKAAIITDTVQNVAIASVPDGANNLPLSALVIGIEPVQDTSGGDPSPNHFCPITGWTGANVVGTGSNLIGGEPMADSMVAAINNQTYCKKNSDDDGNYVTLIGNDNISYINLFPYMKFKENTQYTFITKAKKTAGNTSSNVRFLYTDGTAKNITVGTSPITLDEVYERATVSDSGKTVEMIQSVYSSGTTRFYYDGCGVFEGVLTAADFKPYVGTTYPITWQDEAGTVFGGTVDPVTGELTAEYALDTKTGNDVTEVGQASTGIWYIQFSNLASNSISTTATNKDNLKSNMYVSSHNANVDCSIRIINNKTPICYDNSLDTLAKAEEFYNNNPVQIWYPLATPITYQLDHVSINTLKGVNNLWADCGDVKRMIYPCDTKLYIDKKFTELQALILENA